MAVPYPNGSVPASDLTALDGQPEATLRTDAANAWNRARADVLDRTGITLIVRGWNRTLAEQEQFFFERYEPLATGAGPFNDVRWYKGVRYARMRGAAAAIPGTSNHGWGIAVDVDDYGAVGQFDHPRRLATFPILAQHGWTDTEGRGDIQEPWHLVYDPTLDTQPTTTGFLMTLTATQQQHMYNALVGPNGTPALVALMPFGQNLPTSLAVTRGAIQELLDRTAPVERTDATGKILKFALRQEIADTKTIVAAQAGQIAGLTTALAQVARGTLDLEAITTATETGVIRAIATVEDTGTDTPHKA
ncbi:M15 family metallopeptidase [Oerskovia enterophila]